ncbi:MAG: U32 family peptidase [Rikenellaceae bacterium]
MSSREIELLAPAKDFDSARAAVDHGADAIYMGGVGFGARSAATNSVEDVARAVEYAHQFGVRLYATLNTLIYDDEIDQAREVAQRLLDVGVDALIIQDMAYLRMGLEAEFHASTQMCNMTAEGVRFLQDVGFSRVVLERNLSAAQMAEVVAAAPQMEIEAFIHGAICVGYSGRCYLSRSLSERSGNRGECSQPCRLSYDLVNGEGERIVEQRHLLSVRDFNLSDRVGELLDMGVSSFKIEGRLKDINYIKNVVAHYRKLLDRAIAHREGLCRSSVGVSKIDFEPNPAKSFSRGESLYLFDGVQGGLASLDSPKAMGEQLGSVVTQEGANRIICKTEAKLSNGDGVCFVTKSGVAGGFVNDVERLGRGSQLITLSSKLQLSTGDKLYRNYNKLFEQQLDRDTTRRVIDVKASVRRSPKGIEIEYIDERGLSSVLLYDQPLTESKNRERMESQFNEQLAKCGGTIFRCSQVDLSGWDGEFIPSAQVASMRRELLETLRLKGLEVASESPKKVFRERKEAIYPSTAIAAEVGVTNHLAREFYSDHGVEQIAKSVECYDDFEGVEVMRSSYCIRGEIGECLVKGSKLRDPLFLERGGVRYRLNFDCKECRMALVKL